VYGQQLARLEEESFGALRELDEVHNPARSAAQLNDIATLHGGRRDLDRGNQRAARCPAAHRCTSMGFEWPGIE
jgi:hypothetical protein